MESEKGKVCVTGGTGFVASWLIMRLLRHGYSVNTTLRPQPPGDKKDISYLTNLQGASERLGVFEADLGTPESFEPAIQDCVGVFHVAHPMFFDGQETVETITDISVKATLGILKACLNSKTVKRVVYTSSASTVMMAANGPDLLDEDCWSDLDYVRSLDVFGASYCISKTFTERAALEFAQQHSLDLVTVIPSWIHGPFICPNLPGSVKASLAMLLGNGKQFKYHDNTPFVHTDDVASAHIFLFEHPEAKGRYICSALGIGVDQLFELVSKRYPEFRIPSADSLTDSTVKMKSLSSKKLLDAGFTYEYGIEEMFDHAIQCCKEKGFL